MENLELKVTALEERQKVANKRIDDLEETTKRIELLTISVEKLAMSVEQIASNQLDQTNRQNDFAKRLLEVEQYPTKDKALRLDRYVGQIVSLFIGGVISYLLFSLLGI